MPPTKKRIVIFVFGAGNIVKCKIPAIAVQAAAAIDIIKIEFITRFLSLRFKRVAIFDNFDKSGMYCP
jgi:hypothetical protein